MLTRDELIQRYGQAAADGQVNQYAMLYHQWRRFIEDFPDYDATLNPTPHLRGDPVELDGPPPTYFDFLTPQAADHVRPRLDAMSARDYYNTYGNVKRDVVPLYDHILEQEDEKARAKTELQRQTQGAVTSVKDAVSGLQSQLSSPVVNASVLDVGVNGGVNGLSDFSASTTGFANRGIDAGDANLPLPDIRHNPSNRTYTYYDPKTGPRNVIPFKDKIPGFDWHRDRNLFNMVPATTPLPVYYDEWHTNNSVKKVLHYQDHLGNKWKRNWRRATGRYHGYQNYSFRGTEKYSGCQAVFSPDGNVMTTGEERSTFDYGVPATPGHKKMDMDPHDNKSKAYRDPDLSKVF